MQQAERPPIAAAVIVEVGRVLLIQRAVTEGSLVWQFPAGEVEAGESGPDAAVRETFEEVGLVVVAKGELGERVHPVTGRTMLYVACEVVDGIAHVADESEVAAVAWCTREDLSELVPLGFFEAVEEYLDGMLAPAVAS